MYFVNTDMGVYGPYWHKQEADAVQREITNHYQKLGIAVNTVVDSDKPKKGISIKIIQRGMVNRQDDADWQKHIIK